MSLTTTEEALIRQLLDQQAAILSLAGNESTITSKLGATKVTLADLVAASSVADADLLLTRQGTTDKSVRADILAGYIGAELGTLFAPLASPALTGTPTAPTATAGTNTTQIATTAFVQQASAPSLPAGSLIYCAGSTVPAGYLEANGALLSRTTYAALFAAIGIIYNAGDGSTTFGLPDLRGEFIRGWDKGRGIDAGRWVGSWQEQSVAAHKHVIPWGEGSNVSAAAAARQWGYTRNGGKLGASGGGIDYDNAWHHTNEGWDYDGPVNPAGLISGENRPRNVAALICIKY